MLKIPQNKIKDLISSASSGEVTSVTHSLSAMGKRGKHENDYFEKYGEKEGDIKNRFLLDVKDDKVLAYCMFRLKHKGLAQNDDICIAFDGTDYLFFVNEDITLLTQKLKKADSVIYSHFSEIYEENKEIPKELKYLLTKTEVLNNLVVFQDNFKKLKIDEVLKENNADIIKDKKEDNFIVAEKEVEQNIPNADAFIQNKVPYDKPQEERQPSQQNQNVVYVYGDNPSRLPTQKLDSAYMDKIEQFKRHIGAKLLKEKDDNKRINFRNIKYPLPTNPLEKAIFLNGGTKPILCYGQQGSGKSFTAENYAKRIELELGIPVAFYSILLEKNLDKADIVGSPVLKDDAFNYQKMAEAFMSARDGNLTIFLVDEIFRLKEMGTFFNLFGETHYKLDTGRQLEIVELVVEDIKGELQTTNFCLSDRKVLNPNLILNNGKIQYLKDSENEDFKHLPEQKIKDKLALGEIPIIERKEYEKYNLDALKVSSFFTSEQIKAPIEKLIVIAAGNVGSEYQAHFKLDTDKAFRSRFAICEQPAPKLKDYLLVFEQTLQTSAKKGYIMWDKSKHNIEQEIKNTVKMTSRIFEELFKLIKQNSFSANSNISHRNFVELADNLCKYTNIDSNTIKECFLAQEKAILNHTEGKSTRLVTDTDKVAYYTVLETILGVKLNEKDNSKKQTKEIKTDINTNPSIKSITIKEIEEEVNNEPTQSR